MSKDELWYQCRLQKDEECQVAWIPERGAQKDVFVILDEDDTLWKVIEVYQGPLTKSYLIEKQNMDRRSLLSIK